MECAQADQGSLCNPSRGTAADVPVSRWWCSGDGSDGSGRVKRSAKTSAQGQSLHRVTVCWADFGDEQAPGLAGAFRTSGNEVRFDTGVGTSWSCDVTDIESATMDQGWLTLRARGSTCRFRTGNAQGQLWIQRYVTCRLALDRMQVTASSHVALYGLREPTLRNAILDRVATVVSGSVRAVTTVVLYRPRDAPERDVETACDLLQTGRVQRRVWMVLSDDGRAQAEAAGALESELRRRGLVLGEHVRVSARSVVAEVRFRDGVPHPTAAIDGATAALRSWLRHDPNAKLPGPGRLFPWSRLPVADTPSDDE